MKMPAILAAFALVSACGQTPQSVETPLSPQEALDTAAAPTKDATCQHGVADTDRGFVLCEDGALRRASVVTALSAPHNAELTIIDVAERYQIPPQVFTGMQNATYGNLIKKDRQPARPRPTNKPQVGVVEIEGKFYDVYHIGSDEKTGTIFVERKVQ